MKTTNRYLAALALLGIFLFFTSKSALASQPPQAVSVTPDNLSLEANTPQTFITLYSDPNGASDIRYCYFLINTRLSASMAFYGYYYRSANRLYLYDDQARRWTSGTPGSPTIIENNYVKLNLQNTTVTAQGNNLSINWDITFKDTFAGTKKTYLYIRDNGSLSSGWRELGSVTIAGDPPPENQPPQPVSITPDNLTAEANVPQNFTTLYSDPDGASDIRYCYFLINTYISSLNSFYGYYYRSSNRLYLYDSRNRRWLNGTPGSSTIIDAYYFKLNLQNTTITTEGNNLTINWDITFKDTFAGSKKCYLYISDYNNHGSGWRELGSVTIEGDSPPENQPPQPVSVTPDNLTTEANVSQNFTTLYSDPDGASDIRYCYFLINTYISSLNSFYGYYYRSSNRLYLYDSQNKRWLNGIPGSSTIIDAYYFKLNLQNTTVTTQGNDLSINWNITLKDTFAGSKKCYLYVSDYNNHGSGWRELGSVTIYADTTPPQGSITINDDAEYVNQGQVTLTLSATDDLTGVDKMQFSNDGTTWSPAESYTTSKTWTLSPGDGEKTVHVQFSDVAGNWSDPISDSIILDTTPPVPVITSPTTGYITNSAGILIEGTTDDQAIDTVTIIARLHDGTDYNIIYQWWDFPAANGTFSVDLRSLDYLREGHSRIEAAVQDTAGNSGWTARHVLLDTIQPQGSITISNGAQYTNQTQVTLNLSASDDSSGIAKMRFSNDGTTWSTPEDYSSTKTWSLIAEDGEKTVYVRFSDNAGNWSQDISDTIIFDSTPPIGSIAINDDRQYTTQPQATLRLPSGDNLSGVSQMQFSNDGINWLNPQDYSPFVPWVFSDENGVKTIYAKLKDRAGNWSSHMSDFIILDSIRPKVSPLANVIDKQNVGVVFSEEIVLGNVPSKYLITPSLGTINVTPQPENSYMLFTAQNQIPQQSYSILVSGVRDLAGNEIDPEFNTATFVGDANENMKLVTSMVGEASYDHFGYSVASAGDVNGDGFDDVISGAKDNNEGGSDSGKVYIYFGGSAMDNIADLTMIGESAVDRFGYSIALAGDINGDGFDDVIVGAPFNDANGPSSGKVYIYFGGSAMDNIADITMIGEAANDWFGYSVASAGDINGDGFDDVIVGANHNDEGGSDSGKVYIYFGGFGMDNIADLTMIGEGVDDYLGYSVASAGDVNGDGFSDVIVGTKYSDAGGEDSGKACIFFGGSSIDNIADVTMVGEAAGDYLGYSVASAGDVNEDGFDDVIIGASFIKTYIYFGGSAMDNMADVTMVGEAAGNGACDVNADGFNDIIVKQGDKIHIYLGDSGVNNITDISIKVSGYSQSSTGDVNGNGLDDVIIGAGYSRANGESSGEMFIYEYLLDTVSPKLLPIANVIDKHNVEIAYSEKVKNATDVNNYSIEPSLGTIAIADRGNNKYLLTTTLAQTEEVVYTITVDNITDLSSNLIDPDNNQAVFTGYGLLAPIVNNFDVMDMDSGSKIYTNETTVNIAMTESGVEGEVVKWLIKELDIEPRPKDFLLTQRPTQYTITRGQGLRIIYVWVMDEYNNISKLTDNSQTTITLDLTPPEMPVVTDDGVHNSSFTELHAIWSSDDPESGIAEYKYAIGTTPGNTDIVDWKSVGQATEVIETGLNLIQGQTYYFTVMAKNGAGSWSDEGISDGIIVNPSIPEITNIIPPDGSTYYQGNAISIAVSAFDGDGDVLEYQFSINDEVKQSWGVISTYDWSGLQNDHGLKIIKAEVRDPFRGVDEEEVEIFIFVSPKRSPTHH